MSASADEGPVEPGSSSSGRTAAGAERQSQNGPSAEAFSPEARSQQLRDLANAAYGEGRYAEALELLERAHAAAPYELHEFNLGAVHDRMGHCEQARDHFEAFLRMPRQTGTPAEDQARHALIELHQVCGRAPGDAAAATLPPTVEPVTNGAALPVIPALAPTASESPARAVVVEDQAALGGNTAWRRTLGVGLIGGAAAAAIAAGVAGIRVLDAEKDLRDQALKLRALAASERRGSVDGTEIAALYDSGRRYQALSVGFGVASAVLAGAGAVLLVLDLTDDSAVEVAGGGQPGLTYRQRF